MSLARALPSETSPWVSVPPCLFQVEVGGVLHRHRLGRGRALHRQLEFGGLQRAAGMQHLSVGVERAVKVGDAGDSGGGFNESRSRQVQSLDVDLRLDRTGRHVGRVDRSGLAIQFRGAAGGKIGGDGERELRRRRKVAHADVHVVIHVRLDGRVRAVDRQAAVLYVKLADGKIGRGRRSARGSVSLSPTCCPGWKNSIFRPRHAATRSPACPA